MLDFFLKIVDKIILLLEHRKKHKLAVFQEIVEPLYFELPLVINDMVNFLNLAEELLMSGETRSESAKSLRIAREKYLEARIRIRSMAKVILDKVEDKEVRNLAEKILSLFYTTAEGPGSSTPHRIVDLFETDCEDYDYIHPETILRNIHWSRGNLFKCWIEITETYARLRIKYLS